jgi:hypothetical protein
MLDLICDVTNQSDSIETVQAELARLRTKKAPAAWRAEAEDEIRRWTPKRDKALAKLRGIVAALSADELDLIRRRYHCEAVANRLRDLGIEPQWSFLRSYGA